MNASVYVSPQQEPSAASLCAGPFTAQGNMSISCTEKEGVYVILLLEGVTTDSTLQICEIEAFGIGKYFF